MQVQSHSSTQEPQAPKRKVRIYIPWPDDIPIPEPFLPIAWLGTVGQRITAANDLIVINIWAYKWRYEGIYEQTMGQEYMWQVHWKGHRKHPWTDEQPSTPIIKQEYTDSLDQAVEDSIRCATLNCRYNYERTLIKEIKDYQIIKALATLGDT